MTLLGFCIGLVAGAIIGVAVGLLFLLILFELIDRFDIDL